MGTDAMQPRTKLSREACDLVTQKSKGMDAQSFSSLYATPYTLGIQALASSIHTSRDIPR